LDIGCPSQKIIFALKSGTTRGDYARIYYIIGLTAQPDEEHLGPMKRSLLLLCVALGWLAGGCISANPTKFDEQVRQWVPVGTPLADARHIMEHHGFECILVKKDNRFNGDGADSLDCAKEGGSFHNWSARFFLNNDKVTGYGPAVVE
jgi:hypothetical protein